MWYAVTAKPVKLRNREKKKEFYRGEIEVIINAETREKLEIKRQYSSGKKKIKRYFNIFRSKGAVPHTVNTTTFIQTHPTNHIKSKAFPEKEQKYTFICYIIYIM